MSPRKPRPPKLRPTNVEDADAGWRLFLAVPLSDQVRHLVAAIIGELTEHEWPVRWVGAAGAHLTLHFLGEVSPERRELLRLVLPEVVVRHQQFTLRTAGLGVFPNQRRPRVLWLGLHGPVHRLETLQRSVGAALGELDLGGESNEFHPHITLGRVRNRGTETLSLGDLPEHVRRLLAERGTDAPGAPKPLPVPVQELELVRSHLSHDGARYETIGRFPLSGKG